MIILQSIATLLMTVTIYLSSSIGTPQQQQAVELANQAIVIAQKALQQIKETNSSSSASNLPQPATLPSGVSTTPIIPIVEPIIQTQPTSMKSITIISPIAIKGLGRTYLSRPNIKDEFNYVELGLIVRDDNGIPVKNVTVVITATDSSQNKTIDVTGDVTPRYEDGVKIKTPYYHFSYAFKTPGEHSITFTAEGLSKVVNFNVAEDTRTE